MLDEPEKYQGAPISLQLVGRRYEDEKVRRSERIEIGWGSDRRDTGGRSNGLH